MGKARVQTTAVAEEEEEEEAEEEEAAAAAAERRRHIIGFHRSDLQGECYGPGHETQCQLGHFTEALLLRRANTHHPHTSVGWLETHVVEFDLRHAP